jgi:RecA/RadA recombinase
MFTSGLRALDDTLFAGQGCQAGTLIELSGNQDSGKTALALWFCRTLQQTSVDPIGWICAETNITKRNLEWAGVSPEVVLVRQTSAMPGLTAAQHLIQEGCKLVVLDSIAALIDADHTTPLSQVISADLYRVKCLAIEQGALVILTNQERSRPPGRITSRAGVCPALTRLIDCQIKLQSGQGLYRGGIQVGVRIYFRLVKNGPDFSNWGKDGRFNISYETGLRDMKNGPTA